jgi:5-hydroxyisourate hydrolase
MSQITTHVLDTSSGKPAAGISVKLFSRKNNSWNQIASGVTGDDGRIPNLIEADTMIDTGIYKIHFDTGSYFEKTNQKGFYPYIEIVFEITDKEHYHIPLLLSHFGYSTYRGS